MDNKKKAYRELIAIAAAIVILDQFTKYLVRTNLKLREVWAPFKSMASFFRIIHWKNTGVAFGLFQGRGWLFTIVGLIVVILIIIFYNQISQGSKFWRVALALELGGALGNLIDRINPAVGYVVDFIWIGNFPVFNFADAAIVIGAAILIIGMWNEDDKKNEKTNEISKSSDENK